MFKIIKDVTYYSHRDVCVGLPQLNENFNEISFGLTEERRLVRGRSKCSDLNPNCQ